jgi:hypothetical protein
MKAMLDYSNMRDALSSITPEQPQQMWQANAQSNAMTANMLASQSSEVSSLASLNPTV